MAALATAGVLVLTIVLASMRVAHHAEILAEKVGDPYGSMILTLSAVLVEVVILGIMISHAPSPTLVRDTIYAAVMLDLNGILGLRALIRRLQARRAAVQQRLRAHLRGDDPHRHGISMVVPEFIPRRYWEAYSVFTIGAMLMLYGVFLRMQVGPHSYFSATATRRRRKRP